MPAFNFASLIPSTPLPLTALNKASATNPVSEGRQTKRSSALAPVRLK